MPAADSSTPEVHRAHTLAGDRLAAHYEGAPTQALRAHRLVSEGISALDDGHPSEALIAFEQALKWQKGNPDTYHLMAKALRLIGALGAAKDALALAAARFPNLDFDEAATRASRNALDEAINHLAEDDARGAVSHALKALEFNPWNVPAYYYLAASFARSGNEAAAEAVFTKAVEDFPFSYRQVSRFGEFQGLSLDAPTTTAFYNVLARTNGDLTRFLGGEPIDESMLAREYCSAIEAWRSEKTAAPPLASLLTPHTPNLMRTTRTMLVTPRYVKCTPDWDEYEISFHLDGTARQSLEHYELHDADAIHTEPHQLAHPRSPAKLAAGIAALRDHIERFRPQLVVFEGGFIGGNGAISRDDLHDLKVAFGFRLATIIIDVNPPLPNYADYWCPISDLIVSINENPYLDLARSRCTVLVVPGTPVDLDLVAVIAAPPRVDELLYVGARKRYRDLWCAHLIEAGVSLNLRFTEQSRELSVSAHDFLAMHKSSRLVLNNGLISSADSAMNFRIFEAIAAGAVLVQQDFAGLQDYLVPRVHYAPFSTVPELIATSRMLLARPDIAEEISHQAIDFYKQYYGAKSFWGTILEKALASKI